MIYAARCPHCDQLVGVPEKLPSVAQVRCPLCETAFVAGEARRSTDEAPDLLLEVVPQKRSEESGRGEAAAEPAGNDYHLEQSGAPTAQLPQADETPEDGALPEHMDVLVRCPHCHAESRLDELIVAATGELLDSASLANALEVSDGQPAMFAPEKPGLSPSSSPSGTDAQTSGSAAAAWTRRKPDGNPLGQLISIVLGGLLALPIAYYVLNLIGGEQFDWLSFPLPFASHTYEHLPGWWPKWAAPRSPDKSSEEAPAGAQRPSLRGTDGASGSRYRAVVRENGCLGDVLVRWLCAALPFLSDVPG